MSAEYNEDNLVEQATVDILSDIGWEVETAWHNETFGVDGLLGRQNKGEVILKRYLLAALEKLNPGLPASAYKDVYLEIAQTRDFPSNIRIKAFKGLTRFSDPEVIDGVVELLNNPENYVYYNEIIAMLHEFGMYDNYHDKLRIAAYNAMRKETGFNEFGYE